MGTGLLVVSISDDGDRVKAVGMRQVHLEATTTARIHSGQTPLLYDRNSGWEYARLKAEG
jgi:hypothetical protein